MVKIIKLDSFKITVSLEGNDSGAITSDLHEKGDENEEYNASIDGLESLILAHACAGVDIESPLYREGIETAVIAICDNT